MAQALSDLDCSSCSRRPMHAVLLQRFHVLSWSYQTRQLVLAMESAWVRLAGLLATYLQLLNSASPGRPHHWLAIDQFMIASF